MAVLASFFVIRFLRAFQVEIEHQIAKLQEARLKEAEQREAMRGGLFRRVVAAQESERQRIARELHDETGQALTVFASMLSARLTRRASVDDSLLERIAYFIGWTLVLYLYFRFWNVLSMTYTYQPGRTEGLHLLTGGPLSFNFWVGEILLGIVTPMVLLLYHPTRTSQLWRMVALALVVGGIVAYRWDTNISGLMIVLSYLPGEPTVGYTHYQYFTKWICSSDFSRCFSRTTEVVTTFS